jgi:hypothetical protein
LLQYNCATQQKLNRITKAGNKKINSLQWEIPIQQKHPI